MLLESQIAEDFLSFSSTHPALSHLADVHVQVRGWDDFSGELRRDFALRYRWFGGLPRGVIPIRDARYASQSFRRFLLSDSLPFFSREQFLDEHTTLRIKREEEIVEALDRQAGLEGVILTGAGGVGKTRLGLELCDRLSKRGWLALRLTERGVSASISDLIRAHLEPAGLALFLDYAEKADDLAGIIEEVGRVNDSGSHRIRLIATCRFSALSTIQDAFAPLASQTVTLGRQFGSNSIEAAYADWVVDKILRFGQIPRASDVRRVCHGLPILAAFALFLCRRDAAQFNAQFGDLTGVVDFREWAKRRLELAVHSNGFRQDRRTVLRHLALLALRLPMPRHEAHSIAAESDLDASLFELMRVDGWIEFEDGSVFAIHDVFADAMVAHYVFETSAVANTRAEELLFEGAASGFLRRALAVLDRLAAHPGFDSLNGTEIVRNLIARCPGPILAAHEQLLRGRLLSERGKIHLLADCPELRLALSDSPNCDVLLARLAETLSRLRWDNPAESEFVSKAADVINPMIAARLYNPQQSNMLLRCAFALSPERYRSAVLERIHSQPTALQTHFLLVQWLYRGLPKSDIEAATKAWLSAHSKTVSQTSFVLKAWLDAGCGPEEIGPYAIQWLEVFAATQAAGYVYRAWLDAAGSRKLVEVYILQWIRIFETLDDARFIYQRWLDAGGDREPIDGHVLKWFQVFGKTEEARFVYQPWLDDGGPRELIDDFVLEWIQEFGTTEDARFVYQAWLTAGGSRDLIDEHVLRWIELFGHSEHATHVYKPWLVAGGDRGLIDHHVLRWIEAFGETEAAQFVYKAWLDAGGQRASIDQHVLRWLSFHGRKAVAVYVLVAWLSAEGEFQSVAGYCLDWFAKHSESSEAAFLLKFIVRQPNLPTDVLHAAIRWCARFSSDPNAIWRATFLLERCDGSPEMVAVVRAFLACLHFLSLHRFSRKAQQYNSMLAFNVVKGIGRCLIVKGLDDLDREQLKIFHARLLRHTLIYEVIERPLPLPMILHHVAEMIESGVLDLQADCLALQRFSGWLSRWPSDAWEDLALALSRLTKAAPSSLWNNVLMPPGASPSSRSSEVADDI
jgi:hypothetical protein